MKCVEPCVPHPHIQTSIPLFRESPCTLASSEYGVLVSTSQLQIFFTVDWQYYPLKLALDALHKM